MDHRLYAAADMDVPSVITDANGEVVLSLCRVCGGAEGAMPTECPGAKLKADQLDRILAGTLDFKNGAFVEGT